GAVQPPAGDDPVAPLQRAQHALALGLLALLGSQHDEVEDREHRTEEDERLHDRPRTAAAGRRGGGIREIGRLREIHRESVLRTSGLRPKRKGMILHNPAGRLARTANRALAHARYSAGLASGWSVPG